MPFTKLPARFAPALLVLFGAAFPAVAADAHTTPDFTGHWAGWLAIALFIVAYAFVIAEEATAPAQIQAGDGGRRTYLDWSSPGLRHTATPIPPRPRCSTICWNMASCSCSCWRR